MTLPISKNRITRILDLGRVVTTFEDVRVLVPNRADMFLIDAIHKYVNPQLTVGTDPYGKYDLILCYTPLPFNQEQETVVKLYQMLKTNGRLICTALDVSLKAPKETQKRFAQWLINIDAWREDLPKMELEKVRGQVLIIDRLEVVPKEDKVLRPVRKLRTAKYRESNS